MILLCIQAKKKQNLNNMSVESEERGRGKKWMSEEKEIEKRDRNTTGWERKDMCLCVSLFFFHKHIEVGGNWKGQDTIFHITLLGILINRSHLFITYIARLR